MNKNKLESVMKLHGDTGKKLADYIGVSRQTFSCKINNRNAEFTQGEIAKIVEKYSLDAEQIEEIFFDKKVS